MNAGPSLYNPRDARPEQLVELLTGRTTLLEEILANLREQAKGETRQHWLLRGQRGMGKTHLAGVIHYRVKTDPTLSATYLPLWLGEADTYEVYSAATLLKTIGERLAEEAKDSALLERLNAMDGVGDEEGYFQELAELLSAEADRRQRVLLVMMENLDALLGSFGPKERMEQTRQLRSLLLHNRQFLFISTTPTYYLNNPLDDPKEPLYAHLKERSLDHLTEPETAQLLHKLAQLYPREGTENFLDGKDGRLRLRVIHRLTGGLPRSIVMAFTAIREAAGIGSLVQELRALLDAQTAYFEARLSQLPPRERAIVTTMALAPTNLTMKEIATRSRLPERTLSTLISRLEKDGHVRPMSGSGGKGTVYALSEGLFRLWYQYRKGRPVLEPLVEFLAYWYRAEELENVVTALKKETSPHGASRVAELALLQAEEALRLASSPEVKEAREHFWAECQTALRDEQASAEFGEWASQLMTQLMEVASAVKVPGQSGTAVRRIQQLLQDPSLRPSEERPLRVAALFQALSQQMSDERLHESSVILSVLVEHFHDELDAARQKMLLQARAVLVFFLVDVAPDRAVAETDLLLRSSLAQSPELRPALQAARGASLYKQGRTAEAKPLLEALVAALTAAETSPSQEFAMLVGLAFLSNIYAEQRQLIQATEIAEKIVERFGHRQDEPFRFEVARAKFRLACNPHRSDSNVHQALKEWIALYSGTQDANYRDLQSIVQLLLAITSADNGDPAAAQRIDAWIASLSQVTPRELRFFFESAGLLLIVFGTDKMAAWLSRLLDAQPSAEALMLISWFQMAVEVLAASDADWPRPPSWQSPWRRIPPELHESLLGFIQDVQTLRLVVRKGPQSAPSSGEQQ